jgi:hypothetical protein
MGYVAIALLVALLVALSFLASPMIAFIIVIPLAIVGMVFMATQRRQSAVEQAAEGKRAFTMAGRPTSPTGSRSSGAPASGEGEV